MNLPEVNTFYQGSCLEVLKTWPDNFIHCAITSPPYYALRDYGHGGDIWDGDPNCQHEFVELIRPAKGHVQDRPDAQNPKNVWAKFDKTVHGFCPKCKAWKGQLGLEPTPEMYANHLMQIFRELRRCLRPDGTLWLNLGDSYMGGGKGWDVKGDSSFTRAWDEESDLFQGGMKPPTYITGKQENGLKPKDMAGVPWRVALALQQDGWYLRSDCLWYAPNKCPEAAKDRPSRKHEYIFMLTKSRKYYYDWYAVAEPSGDPRYAQGKNKGTIWTVNVAPSFTSSYTQRLPGAVTHHAAFPEDLVAPPVLASTSEKGCCPDCGTPWNRVVKTEKPQLVAAGEVDEFDETQEVAEEAVISTSWEPGCKCGKTETIPCLVYDPFMGSGTTALVARKFGRSFIGTERNPAYVDLAKRRINFEREQDTL